MFITPQSPPLRLLLPRLLLRLPLRLLFLGMPDFSSSKDFALEPFKRLKAHAVRA